MRDPLLVVLARTHLVAADTPGHRDNLEAIDDAVDALRCFSDDMIDAAHIGAGPLQVEVSPFNISDVAENVVEGFRRRTSGTTVQLQTDGPMSVWWINAAPSSC